MSLTKKEALKQKAIENYQTALSTMISDADFPRFLGEDVKPKIIKYHDLAQYASLDELLPDSPDYKIILTESKRNEGHWCCLLRYGKDVEWFDSYGVKPDGELNFISKAVKKMLGEDKHYLTRLLNTKMPDQNVIYNKKKLQVLEDGINTCGRWTIYRILMMKFGYNLPEAIDFVEKYSRETEKPPDVLICDWIV